MNIRQKSRLRLAIGLAATVGGLVMGGTEAVATRLDHSIVKTVRVGEQPSTIEMPVFNTAGGRVTYR